MKLAICDDDPQELAHIASLLGEYRLEKKVSLTYKAFFSAVDLLEAMRKETFDLLLLDVFMPEFNGMEAAHEIRTFDQQVKLVFLTSSPEFAVESYRVNAYTYLLKPAARETLFPVLDKLFAEAQRLDGYMTVKYRAGIIRILFSRLAYVEVLGKALFFHMSGGTVYEVSGSLAEYEAILLAQPGFMRVHRAFLVNLLQMECLGTQEFTTLDGKTVPVSRRLYAQVRETYMQSLFCEEVPPCTT